MTNDFVLNYVLGNLVDLNHKIDGYFRMLIVLDTAPDTESCIGGNVLADHIEAWVKNLIGTIMTQCIESHYVFISAGNPEEFQQFRAWNNIEIFKNCSSKRFFCHGKHWETLCFPAKEPASSDKGKFNEKTKNHNLE